MQQCSRCKQTKPKVEFYNSQGSPVKSCRRCQEHSQKTYWADPKHAIERAQKSIRNRPEQIRAYKREQNRKHPARYLLQLARTRARKKNIPFNLCVNDITIPKRCPVLGLLLVINDGHCGPNSISLDRIVPSKGYTKENVRVISYKANTIKSNANLDDLRRVVAYLENLSD